MIASSSSAVAAVAAAVFTPRARPFVAAAARPLATIGGNGNHRSCSSIRHSHPRLSSSSFCAGYSGRASNRLAPVTGVQVTSLNGVDGGRPFGIIRANLSTSTATPVATETPENLAPASITPEIAFAVQNATSLFVKHGLGKRKLARIAAEKSQGPSTLVVRWQQMMETYLRVQCHVLSGLGYSPDEMGIGMYNQHLGEAMQGADPDQRELLRIAGRDGWREVLRMAFDIPEESGVEEVSIVDARNFMHKVSFKMQEPAILEKVAQKCGGSVAIDPKNEEAMRMDVVHKHTVVQEVLVHDVYLGGVCADCGFGDGVEGYVRFQMAMAEHQSDPLVQQYVGSAMVRMLQSAGLDMENMPGQDASK